MQVTETLNEGLKRAVKVVVPAKDMEARLSEKLENARGKARINGFRPGKVPVAHMRKMYGKSFMAELVNELINDQSKAVPAGRGEKVAMKPEVSMTEDEAEAAQILDFKVHVSTPPAYRLAPERSRLLPARHFEAFAEPEAAARGADLVTTDVWTSMGFEAENDARKRDFAAWMVDARMMREAKPDALFMHCLPAHRGEEVSAEVIDGPQSVVWDEAENRLHAQKALLEYLVCGRVAP